MFRSIAFLALTSTLATTAAADVFNPLIPSWAGDSGAYTATFNTEDAPFTSAFGGNNLSNLGENGPTLSQTTAGAFFTSTGNIYSFSSPLSFELDGSGPVVDAVLSLSTLDFGASIDFDEVKMFVEGADGASESQLGTAQMSDNFPGGPPVETSNYVFDWSGIDFEVVSWGFTFGSGEATSCAFAGAQVAINTIPAPGALLALGLVGVARRRRS